MKNAVSDIREALSRKFGPLPVWAWALIGGAAIYVYRMRGGTKLGAAAATPSVSDQTTGPGDPTVLQPGESAYNPSTGQLTTAPGGDTGGGSGGGLIPLQPGQTYYDPTTGETVGEPAASGDTGQSTGAGAGAKAHKPKPRSPLAKAKARVAHGAGGTKTINRLLKAGFSRGQISHAIKNRTPLGKPKGGKPKHMNAAKPPTHKRAKTRSPASLYKPGRNRATSAPAKGRSRVGTPGAAQPVQRRNPQAPATASAAMRQRPPAPRVVNHAAQKVVAHPAAKPPPAKRRRR